MVTQRSRGRREKKGERMVLRDITKNLYTGLLSFLSLWTLELHLWPFILSSLLWQEGRKGSWSNSLRPCFCDILLFEAQEPQRGDPALLSPRFGKWESQGFGSKGSFSERQVWARAQQEAGTSRQSGQASKAAWFRGGSARAAAGLSVGGLRAN